MTVLAVVELEAEKQRIKGASQRAGRQQISEQHGTQQYNSKSVRKSMAQLRNVAIPQPDGDGEEREGMRKQDRVADAADPAKSGQWRPEKRGGTINRREPAERPGRPGGRG